MRRTRLKVAATLALAASLPLMLASGCDEDPAQVDPYDWQIPRGFPTPSVPADNPMSIDKVELGRRLFYDTRLSDNGTQACAGCHKQENAFSDALVTSVGSTGQDHFRNAMSLTNVGYNVVQTWSNSVLRSLEAQALIPMFGEDPVELGLSGKEDALLARLAEEPIYQDLFPAAFPETDGAVTLSSITKAIGAFQRTLISGNSPYDQFWYQQKPAALSESEVRGLELFLSERTECFHCHGNFNFSDSSTHDASVFEEFSFHNTALYNLDGEGAYPASDRGLMDLTERPEDMGRFRAPTLRNIGLTAPYMHDGSIATLDEVLDHYSAGGRTITDGPNAGVGAETPLKSNFIKGFELTEQERTDLIAFLNALTDETFITDPRFTDPWPPAE